MWRLIWFYLMFVGALLLLKAVLMAALLLLAVPVVLVLRFVVRPLVAPHLRTPLVDPLNGFKPIK